MLLYRLRILVIAIRLTKLQKDKPMQLSKFKDNISGPNIGAVNASIAPSLNTVKTILLIDDEPMVIDICELMLKELGHTVIKAHSGAEGLKIYEANRQRVDLIISDFNMPAMNGQEVVQQLRLRGHQVKVLLCSGGLSAAEAEAAVSKGFAGFLRKPYNIDTLSEKISASVD